MRKSLPKIRSENVSVLKCAKVDSRDAKWSCQPGLRLPRRLLQRRARRHLPLDRDEGAVGGADEKRGGSVRFRETDQGPETSGMSPHRGPERWNESADRHAQPPHEDQGNEGFEVVLGLVFNNFTERQYRIFSLT